MSNFLDPNQARRFVGPDLGLNSLPRLSADDTSRQRVKQEWYVCSRASLVFWIRLETEDLGLYMTLAQKNRYSVYLMII